MTDGSLETKVAQLAKRIDDQSRFTRALVVICTTAVLGVNFYMLTEIFSSLPAVLIGNFMSHTDAMVAIWDATEANLRRQGKVPSASSQAAPAANAPSTAAPAQQAK